MLLAKCLSLIPAAPPFYLKSQDRLTDETDKPYTLAALLGSSSLSSDLGSKPLSIYSLH